MEVDTLMRARSSFLPPLGIQLSSLLVSVGVTAVFEWGRYRHFFHWRKQDLVLGDRCILFWLLCAKSLWVLLPLLLIVGLLHRLGWRRCGTTLAMTGAAVLSCWLIADLRVLQLTGTHILSYLTFLGDSHAQEWAGNVHLVDMRLVLLLVGAALGSALLVLGCQRFGSRLDQARLRGLAAGVLLVLAFGVLLTGPCLSNPPLIEQLERNLPVQFGWFEKTGTASGGLAEFRNEFDRTMKEPCLRIMPKVLAGQPLDTEAHFDRPNAPNVIIIVLESFRHHSIAPETMPRLARWARQGLRFEHHYAGSNCSQYGIFGLLYGRAPFVYDFTLDAGIRPQLPATFRRSGYRCSYVSSGNLDHIRMNEFITDKAFDEVCLHLKGWWPKRDHAVFEDMARILRENTDRPQMLFAFTMSTHYPYRWGTGYGRNTPVIEDWVLTDPDLKKHREEFLNRYRNALAFMDDEVANFVEKLDLSKNVVVITGDHGESFWEDSRLSHCSRLSDIQTRVPLIVAGPGIPRGTITEVTRHADVLPTVLHAAAGHAVPLQRTHGRDTLAEGFKSDAVVLFPYVGRYSVRSLDHAKFLLLKNGKRLRVRLYYDDKGTKADAYYDDKDDLDTHDVPSPDDAAGWGKQLEEELERLGAS